MKFYLNANVYKEQLGKQPETPERPQGISIYRTPVNFFWCNSPFDLQEVEVDSLGEGCLSPLEEHYFTAGPLILRRPIPPKDIARETVRIMRPHPGKVHQKELYRGMIIAEGDAFAGSWGSSCGPGSMAISTGGTAAVHGDHGLALALGEHCGAAADGLGAHAVGLKHGSNAAASGPLGNAVVLEGGWAISGGGHAVSFQGSAASFGSHGLAVVDSRKACAFGSQGKAIAGNDNGKAQASGFIGEAVALGENGQAEANNARGLAIATGRGGRAKGALGAWLVLAERDRWERPTHVAAVRVDGKNIQPDTWYTMKKRKIIPVAAEETEQE